MNKKMLILGAVYGLLAVIIGAFAAHGLKPKISAEAIQSFETGVRYQMYHALLLLFVGNLEIISAKSKKIIFYLVLIGVIFFSGSIFLLATNTLTAFNFKVIGFITPIGGLLLIISWVVMLINFLKIGKN
ncbi:DUF423 domain-containing protein [Lacinutrix sp. 5H-3-7-4]|uniref:DUF423 domain-containing protein n=1 Tax=Lacinutrix sp. (strain 5H-3-7-4) TaxID=983544 RepID=UPI0002DA8D44|nr:DUF423 domain-containing protein [Lacinutrix sp. 5H-3-7-4]